jgi:hypothetical protein
MSRIQSYNDKNTLGGALSITINNTENRKFNVTSISSYSDKDSEITIKDQDDNILYQNNQEAYCNFNDSPQKGLFDSVTESITIEISDSTDLAYLNCSVEWGMVND